MQIRLKSQSKAAFRFLGCAVLSAFFLPGTGAFAERVKINQEAAGRLLDAGVKEIIFAVREPAGGHWYETFGYKIQGPAAKEYRAAGALCRLDVTSGRMTRLVDDPDGGVRDPVVHYDGGKILFSWRKSGRQNYSLYEIDANGNELKQLTFGDYDDIEPCYLPDGGIAFVSSRCKRWVNCFISQVAVLHRCNGDGSGIRVLSANIEHDNTPAVLPDGRIMYTRWEYVDRSQMKFHHLWTANPDGSNHAVLFGNMHPGNVFIDARPIPGSNEILLIKSPGHGKQEHAGNVAILNPMTGPDNLDAMRTLTDISPPDWRQMYRDPYPVSDDLFLVVQHRDLLVMKPDGTFETLFSLPGSFRASAELHEPRPLVRRDRETRISSRVDLKQTTGTLILNSVHIGRNMDGVEKGDIHKLLVLETLPKPVNYGGGDLDTVPLSWAGTFSLERILGTVPVEPDGSACFTVPANRPLLFVALDENNVTVKRMHSFLSVAPGETLSCIGCHEDRVQTPENINTGLLQALRRPPDPITPVEGVPEVIDYARDIQPIWNKHCISCHNPDDFKGHLDLTDDFGVMFFMSFFDLMDHNQVSHPGNGLGNTAPRSVGDVASELFTKLDGSHHHVRLPPDEIKLIRHWIHVGAPQVGTYAALGTGMLQDRFSTSRKVTSEMIPQGKKLDAVIEKRCGECHAESGEPAGRVPLIDDSGTVYKTRRGFDGPIPGKKSSLNIHLLYNLNRPEKSRFFKATLPEKYGGWGWPENHVIFESPDDPDYQFILGQLQHAADYMHRNKRWYMDGFLPNAEYIREMKRYGILPETFDVNRDPVDVYEIDRNYWESFWYHPPGEAPELYDNQAFRDQLTAEANGRPSKKDAQVEVCSDTVSSPIMKPMLFANEKEVVEYDADGNIVWRTPSGVARDVWKLSNGNVLFPFNQNNSCGVREVNHAGKTVWEYKLPGKYVISCQRLGNGDTLIGASCKAAVLVVNPAGEVVHSIKVRGSHPKHSVTTVRQLLNQNILVVEEDVGYVTEYALDGRVVWEMKTPFRPFAAEQLSSGNILISGQDGIIEVNRGKQIVWQLTKEDVSEMGPRWFAGFRRLPNGNIMICNAGGTVPFFEVNRRKEVVWKTVLTPQNVGMGHGIFLVDEPSSYVNMLNK